VAILLPALVRARATATAVACASNERQIGIALRMYWQENKDWIPPITGPGGGGPYWTTRLQPFMKQANANLQIGQLWMRCGARDDSANYTYGLNYYTASGIEGSPNYDPTYIRPTHRVSKLRPYTYILSDALGNYPWSLWPNSIDWPLVDDVNGDGVPDSATLFQAGSYDYPYNGLAFPHPNTTANFLFTDGSVIAKSIKQWSKNEDGFWGAQP
jgi:prepilin-type processing-associated H-X9-DG protein